MTEGNSYFSGKPEPQRPGAQSRAPARELAELRLRLLSQLDQRVGREKAVLRRTIAALSARLKRSSGAGRGTGQSR